MIEFHLDGGSGVSAYMQVVQQVKQALRLGMLRPGNQLPTVRDVVAALAINPNTVLKAYRELELEGLVAGRQGQGTFVLKSLAGPALADHAELRAELVDWLQRAWTAGMDDESIAALVATTLREQIKSRASGEEGAA
ncbi:MAG: Transcriptional regulator, GntR family [uncultured Thermomicrobiales bacterium]|uniref:Transcriptional regulator, GntR family n=1 Tax=uncultured Thermomicrobiales bacterium TaxID=1645740 RepID=A0A6J4V7L6_9BACT|nr:MAG: Transcriptional regulator, GntR family [uncultured Thermomicrobiales bacterium]